MIQLESQARYMSPCRRPQGRRGSRTGRGGRRAVRTNRSGSWIMRPAATWIAPCHLRKSVGLSSAKNIEAGFSSGGFWFQPVFVVQPRQNRNRDDAMAVGDSMAIRRLLSLITRHVRNARTETGMWAALVVVNHPFLENRTQMPFIQNDQPIQTLATNRADQPLAERIRLRAA